MVGTPLVIASIKLNLDLQRLLVILLCLLPLPLLLRYYSQFVVHLRFLVASITLTTHLHPLLLILLCLLPLPLLLRYSPQLMVDRCTLLLGASYPEMLCKCLLIQHLGGSILLEPQLAKGDSIKNNCQFTSQRTCKLVSRIGLQTFRNACPKLQFTTPFLHDIQVLV